MPVPSAFTSDINAIESRWRPLTDAERPVAERLLLDAADILAERIPTLADRVVAGSMSRSTVERVQAAMVIRVLRNPEGWRSESIDDWRGERDAALSAGLLYLTDVELAQLLPVRARGRSVVLRTHSSP